MSNVSEVSVQINLKGYAADWHAYLVAKEAVKNAEALRDSIAARIGLPSASELAKIAALPSEGGKATGLLLDGNGAPLAKLSLYWKGPESKPRAGLYCLRIT